MSVQTSIQNWPPDRGLRLSRGLSPIGLDIGERVIAAAQLTGRRGSPARLRAGIVIDRTETGALSASEATNLAQTLQRAGFEGREAIVAAPDETLMTAHLELPPASSNAPLDEIARAEVARLFRVNGESISMGYWDLPVLDRAKSGPTAMAVALPEESSSQFVRTLSNAGFEVVGVDARMCSLARACAGAIGTVSGLVGLIEVGWSGTRVLLLHCTNSNWTLVYERRITEACVRNVVESVKQRLGVDTAAAMLALRGARIDDGTPMSPEMSDLMRQVRQLQNEFFEALVPEVQRSISYASQRYSSLPLCGGYLCGEGALIRGLRGKLAQELSLECAPILPSALVQVDSESIFRDACELVCAIGLASFSPVAATMRERSAA
ncbi:MAG: pilus assembly protein PilM [Phycisphaerales bacterium]